MNPTSSSASEDYTWFEEPGLPPHLSSIVHLCAVSVGEGGRHHSGDEPHRVFAHAVFDYVWTRTEGMVSPKYEIDDQNTPFAPPEEYRLGAIVGWHLSEDMEGVPSLEPRRRAQKT